MKKRNNYKLTPEINTKIEGICATLPAFQKTHLGKPQFRTVTRPVMGSDIPEVDRLKIPNFVITKQYEKTVQEPVYINHRVNLNEAYQQKGLEGIEEYIDRINYLDKKLDESETGIIEFENKK